MSSLLRKQICIGMSEHTSELKWKKWTLVDLKNSRYEFEAAAHAAGTEVVLH